MTELTAFTAAEAAAEIARGAISAEEYTRACLDRIAALDGEIRAFVHLDPEHALAQACALDARRAGFDVVLHLDATRAIDAHPVDGERALDELRAAGVQIVE